MHEAGTRSTPFDQEDFSPELATDELSVGRSADALDLHDVEVEVGQHLGGLGVRLLEAALEVLVTVTVGLGVERQVDQAVSHAQGFQPNGTVIMGSAADVDVPPLAQVMVVARTVTHAAPLGPRQQGSPTRPQAALFTRL